MRATSATARRRGRRSRWQGCRPGRSSRSKRSRSSASALNLTHELSGLDRLAPVLDALPGPAYLVGGTVRDLLLERPPEFDFDLTVIGDAESFAHTLARRLDGRVTTHGRFGTATVHY